MSKFKELVKQWARWYFKHGFKVIPLLPGTKRPFLKDWTVKEDIDIAFFEKGCNIGIKTGKLKDKYLIVVDVDDENALKHFLKMINVEKIEDVKTPIVKTRKGYHFYFESEEEIGNIIKLNNMNIDIKGVGGQVVAPPSKVDEHIYKWIDKEHTLGKVNLLPLPSGILKYIDTTKKPIEYFKNIKKGERNDTLASYIGKLLRNTRVIDETSKRSIYLAAKQWIHDHCENPEETLEELDATFNSILKRELARRNINSEIITFETPSEQLRRIGNVNWLWTRRIQLGGLNLIAGEAGLGKSTFACELAVAVATGRLFLGHFKVETGPVLYFDLEDGYISKKFEFVGADVNKLKNIYIVDENTSPRLRYGVSAIEEAIHSFVATQNTSPKLIVIDTLRKTKIDENKVHDITSFYQKMGQIAYTYNSAILIIHHLRKLSGNENVDKIKERISGSTYLVGGVHCAHVLVSKIQDMSARLVPVKIRHNTSLTIPATISWTWDDEGLHFAGYVVKNKVAVEEAQKFLLKFFTSKNTKECLYSEIKEEAIKENIKPKHLIIAADILNIQRIRLKNKEIKWKLEKIEEPLLIEEVEKLEDVDEIFQE